MNDVRMAVVDAYEDRTRIRSFFASILGSDPEIADVLRSSDGSRLVVVKPNWIQESHEYRPTVWEPVITHPGVVLALLEALAEAMGGRGTICLCDAPHTYADFDAIVRRGGLRDAIRDMKERWPRLDFELLDLRREVWIRKEEVVVERRPTPQDPRGYVRLDLGKESLLYRHAGEGRYYGADYDSRVVNEHHRGEVHEYLISGSPMACDLFVNVPKLKTHKKTGITCCLKNLVGINGDKNWLPHFTEDTPERGGDEFSEDVVAHRVEHYVKKAGQRMASSVPGLGTWLFRKTRNVGKRVLGDSQTVVRAGNWHGNDTCWRMALDLNRALLYGNQDGSWRDAGRPKRYLAFVDGIVGGQGDGPLCPDPVASRVLLAGRNPAVLDAVASRLMGFDPLSLPIVSRAFENHRWPIADRPLEEIVVLDERVGARVPLRRLEPAVPGGFKPHFGWMVLRRSA
jgi:uncharacterized protein (DUF362 family)